MYHLNTETLALAIEVFDEAITCLALRKNGEGLACLTATGIATLQGNSMLHYLAKPLPQNVVEANSRFNDGACDRKGRFFAGTIHSRTHKDIRGQLWMYDPESGDCHLADEGPFTDSNGLGWSPDGKTMYFTDSLVNKIFAYDYGDGKLSNRRVAVDALAVGLPEQSFCDGLCVDNEGYIWSARWGGSQINRFSPNGELDTTIRFPTVLHVTACCFGGAGQDKLYVTTAHCSAIGGDATRQKQFPDSGHLFMVDLRGQFKGGEWRFPFGG